MFKQTTNQWSYWLGNCWRFQTWNQMFDDPVSGSPSKLRISCARGVRIMFLLTAWVLPFFQLVLLLAIVLAWLWRFAANCGPQPGENTPLMYQHELETRKRDGFLPTEDISHQDRVLFGTIGPGFQHLCSAQVRPHHAPAGQTAGGFKPSLCSNCSLKLWNINMQKDQQQQQQQQQQQPQQQ